MRRRPDLEVRLYPGVVRPGQLLEIDATFVSRDRTPVKDVAFTLSGEEWVSVPSGKSAVTYRKRHVGLVSHYRPGELPAGRHVCRARFPLPSNAPTTYQGARSRIEYDLRVQVAIPWWLDVDSRFVVPVAPPPGLPRTPRPGVFCSHTSGPERKELYAEASLDDAIVEPGGVLTGAVSFANTRYHRIRGVEVAFVAREHYQTPYSNGWFEARRYRAVVHAGSPGEGESKTFRVIVPPDAPANFEAAFLTLSWRLEILVDSGWKKRPVLSIPIVVVPPPLAGSGPRRTRPSLPSVGRERRVQIWTLVAQRLGLAYDPESESLQFSSGAVHATMGLESRGADGFYTTAQFEWPPLGMDLDVGPAEWTDRFSSEEIEFGDRAFDERFHVRGRIAEQVKWLLGDEVRAALAHLHEVRFTDDGGSLAIKGAGNSDAELARFVVLVRDLAGALARRIDTLPLPPQLAPHLDAWRTFASRLQGRFERGRVWIHEGTLGIDRVEVGTQWNRDGAFDATMVRVALEPPLERALDLDEPDPRWSDATLTLAREIAGSMRALHIGPDAIVAEHAELVANPASLEPRIEKIARLARALQGRSDAGPYR